MAVLKKKSLSGILEVTAKKTGIKQMASIAERLAIKREATIIPMIANNFASGFIDCMTPLFPLKSST